MSLLSFFSGLFSRSGGVDVSPPVDTRQQARERIVNAMSASSTWNNPSGVFTGEKYGTIDYAPINAYKYYQLRRNANGVYHESNIAGSIVSRLVDNVVNTGLTWESTPLWELLQDGPTTEEQRRAWTRTIESMWKLYAESKEADIRGIETFQQLQKKAFRLGFLQGEFFGVIRYLNSPSRMSPVALQFIKSSQVDQPTDYREIQAIEKRGGKVDHGIEYDSTGKMIAIHVHDGITSKSVRIPVEGTRSGRRFVLHSGNYEAIGQERGLPELSKIVYELKKLTDYDVAELEAVVGQAAFMAMFEADVQAKPGKAPSILPNVENKDDGDNEPKAGIEKVYSDKVGLIINRMEPGYQFKGFSPTRPNQNYNAFVESFETRIAGTLGMPRSVLSQRFQSSYSAARAEILFFWNSVKVRRYDLAAGFLSPYYEAWFSEHVRQGKIQAENYDIPMQKRAWLYGHWDGISRPVVDPVKEVKAVESRLTLGHTTGEREAKAYNGSDYMENVERLKVENAERSEANKSLNPVQPENANGKDNDNEGPDND